MQKEAMATMGPVNPLTDMQKLSNTLKAMTELAGFKDVSQFWSDPSQFQAPPQEDKPDINEQLIQVQIQQIQADIQKKAADLQLQREDMMRKDDRERDKLASEQFVKLRELELKYNAQINEVQIKAEIERDRNAQEQMQMQMSQQGMPPQ